MIPLAPVRLPVPPEVFFEHEGGFYPLPLDAHVQVNLCDFNDQTRLLALAKDVLLALMKQRAAMK